MYCCLASVSVAVRFHVTLMYAHNYNFCLGIKVSLYKDQVYCPASQYTYIMH